MADRNITSFPIPANYISAAKVPYDNTGSGLTATDTQAAVDEIAPFFVSNNQEVSNGNLKVNKVYLLQIKENAESHRFYKIYRASTATYRLDFTDMTTAGYVRMMCLFVAYSSGTLSINGGKRAYFNPSGEFTPAADWTNATIEHIFQLSK